MADDDSYEIMPHHEIAELKRQLEELKSKASDSDSQKLINSMNALAKQLSELITVFRNAAEEMKTEEKDEHFVAKKMEPLLDRMDAIVDQNKTIAEGMVAVADIIKEHVGQEAEKKLSHFSKPKSEFGPHFEPPKPDFSGLSHEYNPTKQQRPPESIQFPPPRPMQPPMGTRQMHPSHNMPPQRPMQQPRGMMPPPGPMPPSPPGPPPMPDLDMDLSGEKKGGLFGRFKK